MLVPAGGVIFEAQGPVDLSCFSMGKSELSLGRDVLIGNGFLHGLDGLCKTLDCMLAEN